MPRSSFASRLAALATLIEPTRERLYRHVARAPKPVSRDDAAEALGVTRSAAAFHLDRLVAAGLLRAGYMRLSGRVGRGAGRPSKLYRRSRHRVDISLPARNHELLARLLLESARESVSSPAARASGRHAGELLGNRARRRLGKSADDAAAARCLNDVLEEIGFEPTTTAAGETWMRSCPFDPLSRQYPETVCQAALGLVGGAIDGLGASTLAVRRRDLGGWCCVVVDNSMDPAAAS
jgi:predicted ArsR family transcriptional regulator